MILTKQMHQKSVIFVITGIFLYKNINFGLCLCNGYHDLMQKAMNFNDAAIISFKESDYRTNFWYMSKDDALNITNKSNLNEKSG